MRCTYVTKWAISRYVCGHVMRVTCGINLVQSSILMLNVKLLLMWFMLSKPRRQSLKARIDKTSLKELTTKTN